MLHHKNFVECLARLRMQSRFLAPRKANSSSPPQAGLTLFPRTAKAKAWHVPAFAKLIYLAKASAVPALPSDLRYCDFSMLVDS